MKRSNLYDILYSLKPLNIEAGDDYIAKHQDEGPSRELCNIFGNVITVLPSGKNGETRRSESLGEYQCHLFLEYHPLVVGYLEQPPTRMIRRSYAKGERLTRYTPDVGVKLKNDANLVIEYKPSGFIQNDLKKEHPRFSVGDDDRFHDLKAEMHFRELGVHFLVVTEVDFGPEFFRNMSLLCSYYQSERPSGALIQLVDRAIAKVGLSTLERLVLSVEEYIAAEGEEAQNVAQ